MSSLKSLFLYTVLPELARPVSLESGMDSIKDFTALVFRPILKKKRSDGLRICQRSSLCVAMPSCTRIGLEELTSNED